MAFTNNCYTNYEDLRYSGRECDNPIFDKNTIKYISQKVTENLEGLDSKNRSIIVPDNTIVNVLDTVYNNYVPSVGGLYKKNIQYSKYEHVIAHTIDIIVDDVSYNISRDICNSNRTIWTTLLGDFNDHKLRSHPPIKIRNKRPQPMQFNMNY